MTRAYAVLAPISVGAVYRVAAKKRLPKEEEKRMQETHIQSPCHFGSRRNHTLAGSRGSDNGITRIHLHRILKQMAADRPGILRTCAPNQ